jgi:hypothetical protein
MQSCLRSDCLQTCSTPIFRLSISTEFDLFFHLKFSTKSNLFSFEQNLNYENQIFIIFFQRCAIQSANFYLQQVYQLKFNSAQFIQRFDIQFNQNFGKLKISI